MTRRAVLRASDADREQIAERLRQAAAEGRLFADELEERLSAAFSARTYGELDAIVADLPAPVPAAPARTPARGRSPVALVSLLVPLMIILAIVGVALGHGHHADGGSVIWLVWLGLGLRLFMRRRGRIR